ncbi:LptF/LptG family permease [bacterium]|nr:LptF/LptG family permease [bacterium]
MFIIPRYIIKRHIFPFIFGFSVIIFLILSNILMRDLYKFLGKGLTFTVIVEAILLNIAWIVVIAIPMGVLVSSTMAFGRMSQDNEITALRSCSVSTTRMLVPVLLFATVIGLFTYIYTDKILPEANYRARTLMTDIHKKKPTIAIEENIFFDIIPNYRLLIKKVERNSHWVYDVTLFDQTNPNTHNTITAQKGTFEYAKYKNKLLITFYDGEMHSISRNNLENYQRFKFKKHAVSVDIPGTGLERSSSKIRGDREKNIAEMKKDVCDLTFKMENQYKKIYSLLKIKEDVPNKHISAYVDSLREKLNFLKSSTSSPENQAKIQTISSLLKSIGIEREILKNRTAFRNRFEVEIQKKYSIPAACIVFVLIGMPIGIMSRKSVILIGGLFSLLLFVIYWGFLIGGESLSDRGLVPAFWAMWTPNIIIGIIGIFLLIHISKEQTVLSFTFLKKLFPFRKKN